MKTTSLKPLILSLMAGSAFLSLTTLAEARGPGGRGMERPAFEEIDANADGAVTAEELVAHMASRGEARFDAADTDGNGSLSRDEAIAAAREGAADRAGNRFDRLDADGDGELTRAEAEAAREGRRGGDPAERVARLIDRADTDNSGSLSAEEWENMPQRGGNRGHRGGERGGQN